MAIRSINQDPDVSSSINLTPVDIQRESRRRYTVLSDDSDDETAILDGCGFVLGTRHPTSFPQVLTKLEVELEGRVQATVGAGFFKMWRLTASWGPFAVEAGQGQFGSPISLKPRFRFDWRTIQEPAWRDIEDEHPIVNSANDPFDPPVVRDAQIGVLTITRNELSPNLPAIMQLSGSLNGAPWLGFPAKTVRLLPVSIPEREFSQESQISYYPMSYTLEICMQTWRARVINAGFREKSPTQADQQRVIPILDSTGQPVASPALLSEAGTALKPPVAVDQVVVATFDIYPSADFGVLGFDDLFGAA